LPKESIEEEESLPSDKPAETEEMPETSNKDEKSTIDNEKEKIEESKSIDKPEGEVELEEAQVEEIYVKFKGKSYMHCEWKSLEELEEIDKRIIGKINRYKAKFGESYDDSEYFNEDYTVVDRV
jgi:chromodomain-helicase-DNA-binding protein 7